MVTWFLLVTVLMQGKDLHDTASAVMTKLQEELVRRFITDERVGHREDLLVSTMLDPRFKHFVFPGATLRMRNDAKKYFRAAYDADWSPEAMSKRAESIAGTEEEQDDEGDDCEAQEHVVASPPKKKARATGAAMFLGLDCVDDADEEVEPAIPQSEVDVYLALPQMRAITPSGKEACPLEWWRGHQSTLPHLSKMARQFLALPASSAGPERLFHAAGRMHDDKKKSTKDTTMEHMLNVYSNT